MANPKPKKDEEEVTDEEMAQIKADSEKVESQKAEADAKRKKALEAKEEEDRKGLYSKAEMQEEIAKAIRAYDRKKEGLDDLEEEDQFKIKKLTIPRFKNKEGQSKFIVAFVNTNVDEYFKDRVDYAFDVWNDLTKRNDPYVKVLFEDDSEMTLPLLTVIKRSQKVLVDILETKKVDQSYSAGRTEVRRVDGYSNKSEGTVPMKVTKYDYSFVVKLPDGRELPVAKEVVNWNIIPA